MKNADAVEIMFSSGSHSQLPLLLRILKKYSEEGKKKRLQSQHHSDQNRLNYVEAWLTHLSIDENAIFFILSYDI